MSQTQYILEVISDVVCPWCYIGKARLYEALKTTRNANLIDVRWRPYELNPQLPANGMDRAEYCRTKFGSKEYADQLYDNIAANAAADNLPFDHKRISRTPNTRTAHRLIYFAERAGCADQMVDRLFAAYFVEAKDLGDLETLIECAVSLDLDRDEVKAFLTSDEGLALIKEQETDAYDYGVQGVPAFIFNGQYLFAGAQATETIQLMLEQAMAKADLASS